LGKAARGAVKHKIDTWAPRLRRRSLYHLFTSQGGTLHAWEFAELGSRSRSASLRWDGFIEEERLAD